MYKNLNATVLGVSGRQSELIELAMTYGFSGLDIDIVDLVKRTQRSEFEKAARYLLSAKSKPANQTPIDGMLEIQPTNNGPSAINKIKPLGMVVDQAMDCHRFRTNRVLSAQGAVMRVPSSTIDRRHKHPPT